MSPKMLHGVCTIRPPALAKPFGGGRAAVLPKPFKRMAHAEVAR
jgi:hypothetical protein